MRIGKSSFGIGLGGHSPAPAGPPPPAFNLGLFVGGYSGGRLAVTDKYDFGTDTVASGTNLPVANDSIGGTGNTVMAVFNGWVQTQKYVYATNSATATTLSIGPSNGTGPTCAASNETRGVFVKSGAPTATGKYFYADDSTANGTALPNGVYGACAVGTSIFGLFAGGNGSLLSSKYTYSGDTTAAAASLPNQHYSGCAAGSTSVGIFFAGINAPSTFLTTTSKYTYAGNTTATSTAMNIRFALDGCGNATRAIFGAGIAELSSYTKLNTTQKYTYAGDVVAAATSLITARYDLGAASSSPGGFS